AMREGADVIYQASFFDGRWRGHADVVCRVDAPSDLGTWSYEAFDAKLARTTTAGALLQLGDYTRQIARLQGCTPRRLHVVLGDDSVESFPFAEISSYLEAVRRRFVAAVDRGLESTVPDPVAACQYCDWKDRCNAQWRAADHLSFVAGIRRDQRTRLVAAGIDTRAALGALPAGAEVDQIRGTVLDGLRVQAGLQVRSDHQSAPVWSLIEPDADAPHRGLAALPAPTEHDIFFDMEGDLFAAPGGREYLFGWVEGDAVDAQFRCRWAHDAAAEKEAFETFIDTVMETRRRQPAMHVYHYAAYEPAAMKRLMGRYATREEEVDELLRAGVFVDLYRVVRQGVRVGVESYSIKKLEPLYMAARDGGVTDAGSSIVEYEAWLESPDDDILESIRAYNEVDCRSLVGLRGWLERRRDDLERTTGAPVSRPALTDGAASDAVAAGTAMVEALAAELTVGIPVDTAVQSTEQRARSLLAALLDWHRRDAKPQWWEYFARQDASDEELIEDGAALGGLVLDSVTATDKKVQLFRFRFPPQETKLAAGDDVEDSRTDDDGNGGKRSRRLGKIHAIDTAAGWLVLKRLAIDPLPTALIPGGPPPGTEQRGALLRLGRWVAENGIDSPGRFRAVRDLLMRNRPRIGGVSAGAALRRDDEDIGTAARRSILDADCACLPIQGPPGSGKTYTGAMAIVDLVTDRSPRRVAVTALSHRAITQLLRSVCAEARRRGVTLRVVQKSDGRGCDDDFVQCVTTNDAVVAALDSDAVDVVAGTAWLFAREDMDGRFDTLFVDEAGQLSLANVVAVGGCARNIVLLGDPQQLEQPSQGAHPAGAELSALGHLVGEHETIPDDRGLFLDVTWRMHPEVCGYISDNFYDSRLASNPDCARQQVLGDDALAGAGLRWLSVEHTGNRSASEEEAVAVAELVQRLVGRRWVDRHDVARPLNAADVLVVAPYNAHVAALRAVIPEDVAVGTVDRFQGQEAAVVIYSMATSMAEDVPRGMEFLYSRNRMNVAVSRARCLAVLVCSPDLLRVACSTAAQIPLANALCSFVDGARLLDPAALGARLLQPLLL
ncbi:MAG TPA: TM0106 family RecB-like putative nuclease, partial [Candidatus Dormibacteraeota bacterium]|nr:TM0106 family RecB-like putative nuclease [Candidatus Dormibacteraeota bacterium]